jgi:hypothetical protein
MTFNASAWIAANTVGQPNLNEAASSAVGNFTTIWNYFESALCDNRATVAAFERIAEQYDSTKAPPATLEKLASCLSFWQFRYRTPDGFSPRFDGLYFRPNDRRHHVEEVLNGQRDNPRDKILALMIIVYRLRNNLFHGIKSVHLLNDQVQNLDNASHCLAAILESTKSHLVERRFHKLEHR